MQITLSSFGFSHGAMEADYVFDLRFSHPNIEIHLFNPFVRRKWRALRRARQAPGSP